MYTIPYILSFYLTTNQRTVYSVINPKINKKNFNKLVYCYPPEERTFEVYDRWTDSLEDVVKYLQERLSNKHVRGFMQSGKRFVQIT